PHSLMQRIDPMRDLRDAKAMAQTLREALKTKSVSLTHSETLVFAGRAKTIHAVECAMANRLQSGSKLRHRAHRGSDADEGFHARERTRLRSADGPDPFSLDAAPGVDVAREFFDDAIVGLLETVLRQVSFRPCTRRGTVLAFSQMQRVHFGL